MDLPEPERTGAGAGSRAQGRNRSPARADVSRELPPINRKQSYATIGRHVGLIDNGYQVQDRHLTTRQRICRKNKKPLQKPTKLSWSVQQRLLGPRPEKSHRSPVRLQRSPRKRANCQRRTSAVFPDYRRKLIEKRKLRSQARLTWRN